MSIGSVLITGANRGLGLEFVKQFVALPKPPLYLFATCRDPNAAADLQEVAKAHPNVHILKFHAKDYEQFPVLHQQIEKETKGSGLNLLINNAAICSHESLTEVSSKSMMEHFEINVASPLQLTKELLPLLQKAAAVVKDKKLSASRAAVVNITSKMGSVEDNTSGGSYPYRVSKAALNMATKSLSLDLKQFGILAFMLHPGWVLTDMGGPKALLTPQTSVSNMMNTILKASDDQSGVFLNYDGKPIPW